MEYSNIKHDKNISFIRNAFWSCCHDVDILKNREFNLNKRPKVINLKCSIKDGLEIIRPSINLPVFRWEIKPFMQYESLNMYLAAVAIHTSANIIPTYDQKTHDQ